MSLQEFQQAMRLHYMVIRPSLVEDYTAGDEYWVVRIGGHRYLRSYRRLDGEIESILMDQESFGLWLLSLMADGHGSLDVRRDQPYHGWIYY